MPETILAKIERHLPDCAFAWNKILQRNYVLIVLGFLSMILTLSCQNNQLNITENSQHHNFKVAAILPRDINTDDWSKAGYDALQAIKKNLGATISYRDKTDISGPQANSKFAKIIREYGQQDYDFIFAHGGQFVKAIEMVAKEFPRTKFAVSSSYSGNNRNAGGVIYRNSEVGYLIGVAAGLATKTNKIFLLGGPKNPNTLEKAEFWQKGAKFVNPQVKLSISWLSSFTDQVSAQALTQAAIDKGFDVLSFNAANNNPNLIKMVDQAGLKAIALNKNYHDLAPQSVVTCMIPNFSAMYLQAATLVLEGKWEGKQYRFGLREGAIDMTPFNVNLNPEKAEKFRAIQQDIKLDRLKIFVN